MGLKPIQKVFHFWISSFYFITFFVRMLFFVFFLYTIGLHWVKLLFLASENLNISFTYLIPCFLCSQNFSELFNAPGCSQALNIPMYLLTMQTAGTTFCILCNDNGVLAINRAAKRDSFFFMYPVFHKKN